MQQLTILFADLANSTKLYQTEGDVRAHELIADSLLRMKDAIELHEGALLRTVGDAALASFDTVADACRAACEIQRLHEKTPLSLRVGFHVGDVIPDSGDIYGNAVNLAARVASFANAGEIYTTHDSVGQLPVPLRSGIDYLDKVMFKGISEPMQIYRVNWSDIDNATEIKTRTSLTQRVHSDQVLALTTGTETVYINSKSPSRMLGRELDNDVIVDHESTSRYHAVVEQVRGRFVFRDTSTNGSYVAVGGDRSIFLRREEISLATYGDIGLGWKPEEESTYSLSYKVLPKRHSTE